MDLELSNLKKDRFGSKSNRESSVGYGQLDDIQFDENIENKDKIRSKTSLRMLYEAQKSVIRDQIGGLEAARIKLGLSQRKISQLLMVDPSAWTRWTRNHEDAPPHVYRSLQWYLALNEKIPGLTPSYFIGKDSSVLSKSIEDLNGNNKALTERLIYLEKSQKKLRFLTAFLSLVVCIMSFFMIFRLLLT